MGFKVRTEYHKIVRHPEATQWQVDDRDRLILTDDTGALVAVYAKDCWARATPVASGSQ